MEKLKDFLLYFENPRILDIATGRGSFVELLTHIYDGYSEIIGIDHNPKAIEAAENSFDNPRISFKQMDANDMGFEKKFFDIVCLSNSMHHLEDINNSIDKMAVLVKPGGILLFNEMISDNKEEQQMVHTHFHHFWAEVNRTNGIIHNETMKKQEIIDIFNNHPQINLEDTWEMQVPGEGSVPKEAYEQLKNTLSKSLVVVEEHPEYSRFKSRAKELEALLDKVGFKAATQVIVIAKPIN